MTEEMEGHPEEPGAPLIGEAVTAILCDQFGDELRFGTPDHPNGTNAAWMKHSQRWLELTKRELTFTNLLMCQATECAAKTDPTELRRALASLGGTVVQWIESLDRHFGVV